MIRRTDSIAEEQIFLKKKLSLKRTSSGRPAPSKAMLASSARAARLRPAILDAFSCKHLHLVTWNRTRTRAKTVTVSISSYAPSKFSPASQQGSNPRAQRFPSLTLENGSSSSKNHNGLSSERRSSCVRFSSSVPAMDEYEWNDSGGKGKITTDVSRDSVLAAQQLQDGRYIPVKAYFLSTSVDLKSLQVEQFFDVVPPASRSANYVILKYSNKLIHHSSINASSHFSPHVDGKDIEENKDSWSNFHYMVVFQYGSVVLFNISEQEEGRYLENVKKYALGLLSETRKDDYAVVEKPSLETWMQGGPDYVVLKKFDIDGIRIIGSVLGQSIALDHFVRQVDGMLVEFIDLNRGMEKTGTFTMKQKKLFQLVGKANSNLADVILKLGLFERSDIAWKNAKYAEIWEYLRDEYELTQRFGSLDFKLKFVEHNVRFFLEIQHNRKTEFLEWLIIYLISAELVIAIFGILR